MVASCLLFGLQIFTKLATLLLHVQLRAVDRDPMLPHLELSAQLGDVVSDQATPVLVVASIAVLVAWVMRARRNLGALGAGVLPRIYGPSRILRQLWIQSQPGDIVIDGKTVPRRARPVDWWATLLLAQILTLVLVLAHQPIDDHEWVVRTYLYIVPALLGIAAAAQGIRVVIGIDERQEAQHQHLVAERRPPPAPDRPL